MQSENAIGRIQLIKSLTVKKLKKLVKNVE